jgi:hypothetical protein
VLEQQVEVAILDLLAGGHVGQIDQRAVKLHSDRDQDVLDTPLRGHRLGREVLGGVRPVALDVAAQRGEVGPEAGENLAQAGLRELGAVERAWRSSKRWLNS